MPIPPSWTKKRQAAALAGVEWPTGRPDSDNLAKGVLDALNGILWGDDAAVVELTVSKRYCTRPRTCVTVRRLMP
jgi:Holliday junction resolvase RusA-like endonuclease